MDDYISRKTFIEQKRKLYCENCSRRKDSKGKTVYEIGDAPCRACGIGDVLDDLDDFTAADVRPVVRAQIIDMRYVEEDGEWKCSRCGLQYTLCVCGKDVTSEIHFCPRCGADMRPTSMPGAKEES